MLIQISYKIFFIVLFFTNLGISRAEIKRPEKILALEYSVVESLLLLGINPIGIADDGDINRLLPELKNKIKNKYTSIGTRKHPQMETMASLIPDLIIGDIQRHQIFYSSFKHLAPTLLTKGLGASYQEILQAFQQIAKVVKFEEKGLRLLDAHKAKIQEYKTVLKDLLGDKKVLFGVSWENGVHIHTSQAFVPSLFFELGINYVVEQSFFSGQTTSQNITLEQILKINPDILILARSRPHVMFDEWKKSALWSYLTIAKKNSIIEVDQDYWTRNRGMISAQWILQDLIRKLKKS